jgi:hypothetical protein
MEMIVEFSEVFFNDEMAWSQTCTDVSLMPQRVLQRGIWLEHLCDDWQTALPKTARSAEDLTPEDKALFQEQITTFLKTALDAPH